MTERNDTNGLKHSADEVRLEELREAIDDTDRVILGALSRRQSLSEEIGPVKRRLNLAPHQPERQQEMLDGLAVQAPLYGLAPDYVRQIFGVIHDHSVELQRNPGDE